MLRVLADYHHGDLFHSLQLLFEKRLGWRLYRPVAMEWYHEGFWNVYPHIDTARQYLDVHEAAEVSKLAEKYPNTMFSSLNRGAFESDEGFFVIPDVSKPGYCQNGITLPRFKETKFDIIIASMPQHLPLYQKLIEQYQPQAKLIFQMGNEWGYIPGCKNILASTAPFDVPKDVNVVFYHQEFDLNLFTYEPPTNHTRVRSYIHVMQELELRDQYRTMLSDWDWKSFGALMDQTLCLTSDIAAEMKDAGWTWHVKPGGDGYGYGIHHSYARGRPLIVKGSYYRNRLAERLMVDNETCIDVSRGSVYDNCLRLRQAAHPENHIKMCEKARARFNDVVDFNRDEQNIRRFLENLR